MKKPGKSAFVCQECGEVHTRWAGRCQACGNWNTIVEERAAAFEGGSAAGGAPGRLAARPLPITALAPEQRPRLSTGIAEFNRVLGGGLVPASAILVGGDPGVGKSTLLLEMAAHRAAAGDRPLYVSAEESAGQVALRAQRLRLSHQNLMVLAEDRLERIIDVALDEPPSLLVLDSIQTVRKSVLGSAAGSVAQVRECAADLIAAARQGGFPVALVGHVTKDGMLAGPKLLEHLVDVVLYFEGERDAELRLLRAIKNRYGPAGEVAVFAMGERGLVDPERPAAAFLGRAGGRAGAVVAAAVEGSRVFLVEIQALTAPASSGAPRVRANGVDPGRAAMLGAVLCRRAGLALSDQDIYVNVAGGFRLSDPGCDLAVCLAIASSFVDRAMAPGTVVFGEVGLSGEVRPVRQAAARAREAQALGFTRLLGPEEFEGGAGRGGVGRLLDALEHLG